MMMVNYVALINSYRRPNVCTTNILDWESLNLKLTLRTIYIVKSSYRTLATAIGQILGK